MECKRIVAIAALFFCLETPLPFLVSAERSLNSAVLPLVINTWPFVHATSTAWEVLQQNGSPVEAIVAGCRVCEEEQCDLSVGYGGSPDENGETTLDAMVMDGDTFNVGAVGDLRGVKGAIEAAQLVLEHTEHTMLVGDQATSFAISMGAKGPESLTTNDSNLLWQSWKTRSCQPNYRANVLPYSKKSCGPYNVVLGERGGEIERSSSQQQKQRSLMVDRSNHDTITMVAISKNGSVASGGSTNGLTFKVPGRVGDTPIPGAGSYADSEVGGCGATGDGDIMLRFLPCYQAVESLRQGMSPEGAARDAIARIRRKYPAFVGALFVVSVEGVHGGATSNWDFQYSVKTALDERVQVFDVYDRA